MNDTTIEARIVTLSDKGAVLDIDGRRLDWPRTALPTGAAAGQRVYLRLMSESEASADKADQARAIISEILGAS